MIASNISGPLFRGRSLDSPIDRRGGEDGDADSVLNSWSFGSNADSDCFRCSGVTEMKTAELLYMSPDWDYYYCYRCRGWFKRPFEDWRTVLPVTDGRVVKQLTWAYTSQLQAVQENRQVVDGMTRLFRGLGRLLPRG